MSKLSRRRFLKSTLAGATAALAVPALAKAAPHEADDRAQAYGVLVDLALCVGCRRCEAACHDINKLPDPAKPFTDLKVIESPRRMDHGAYTIVNQIKRVGKADPVNVKLQCMHCNDPACASACLVGALRKEESGAVSYTASKCMGCRYCMVACPFGVPAYDYHNPTTPEVRKCTFCAPLLEQGKPPACVQSCPKEALIFGRRAALLDLARDKIAKSQQAAEGEPRYVNHIYGEHEVGGTSWLYVAPASFTELGFLALPEQAPPRLTETIQHGVFKQALPPIALFSLLGAAMHVFKRRDEVKRDGEAAAEKEHDHE